MAEIDIARLRVARKKIESAHYPNVQGVAIGFKERNGRRTKEVVVVVYVAKKLPESQLVTKHVVPKAIDVGGRDVKTDVIQKKFEALELVSFDRPIKPGYSISHPDVTAGTLGFFARRHNQLCLISNAHVIANTNDGKIGDPAYYPGTYDGGSEKDTIGYLVATVPIEMIESTCPIAIFAVNLVNKLLAKAFRTRIPKPIREITNRVDCAASLVAEGVEIDEEIYKIGKPTGLEQAVLGMKVQKSGRTTEYTEGTIIGIEATIQVGYSKGTAIFEGQIISDIPSAGGDSGSAILTHNKLVGLLFAGGEGITIMNPIEDVFQALELEI